MPVEQGIEVLGSSNLEIGGAASAPETGEPVSIKPQSWKGYFVDPTTQDPHIFLHDAYYAVGGFRGDIPVNEYSPDAPNTTGTYSYVQFVSTELQYRLRAKITPYYNYFARFIDSTIMPVFSHGKILTLTKKGEDTYEDKEMESFIYNASGTGTEYTAMQKYAMQELAVHDAVYYSMTKIEGDTIPSLSIYRAVDVINIDKDEHGRAKSYMFHRGRTVETDDKGRAKTVANAIKFYMENGYCIIQLYKADYDDTTGIWNNDYLDWKENGAPRNTGVQEWCVYAHLPVATPNNEMLPSNPSSRRIADVCLSIFQHESRFSWLYAVHNSPTPYIYGNIKGMLAGMGQMVSMNTTDPTKGYAPEPDFMQLNPQLLTASHEVIKYDVERLREIAKENGVDTKTGAQAQSGDSKRFDFQATEQKLRGTVDKCEEMDKWVFHMFDIYTNRNTNAIVFTYDRTYPESFYPDEEPSLDDFEAYVAVAREIGANTAALTAFKQWGRNLLKDSITDEEGALLDEEIETMTLARTSETIELGVD